MILSTYFKAKINDLFPADLFQFKYALYRIYSINRPRRLLNFWTLRVGAYSRLGAY